MRNRQHRSHRNNFPKRNGLLLVGFVLKVKSGELVRLPVRGNRDDGDDVLSSEDQSSGDDGVVGLAEHSDGSEEVLSGSLESGKETSDLVAV